MEEALKRPLPLITEKHSLEPDMIFGWRPTRLQQKAPIPLKFQPNYTFSKQFLSSKGLCAIYNAPHPTDSFILHKTFQSASAYNFDFSDGLISAVEYISKKNVARSPEKRSFVNMLSQLPLNSLHFNSDFESGNLDKVFMLNENQYDLLLRSDTNSLTSNCWFYFEISNITYSRVVELNILNLPASVNLFDIGYRPVMYSQFLNNSNDNIGWEKFQGNFKYSKSKLNHPNTEQFKNSFYQITLELELTVNDIVKIAASVPYTCSTLYEFLNRVPTANTKVSQICQTLSGVPVPLVTITNRGIPKSSKKYVILFSRIHPEETCTSHIAEGVIEFLTGQDHYASMLRDRIIFKIVPMANPDGLIGGNSRNSFAGRDLNKCFKRHNSKLFPVPYYIYQLVKKHSRDNKVFLFVDVRGQHKKKGTFVYGPYYPIHDRMYYQSKIIPTVFSGKTCMFRYYSCRYTHDKHKMNRARDVFDKDFAVLGYSLVNSMHSYLDENRETREYTVLDFKKIGETLCLSILEYLIMLEENKRREQERAKLRYHQRRTLDLKTKQFMTMQHVIDNIKRADDNFQIDSDLEEWSNHEEDLEDDHILTEISSALDEFNSYTNKTTAKKRDAKHHRGKRTETTQKRQEPLKLYPVKKNASKHAANLSLCSLSPEPQATSFALFTPSLVRSNVVRAASFMPKHRYSIRPPPYSLYKKFGPFPHIRSRIT